jgi:ribonucleotide reductase beta subunit family protein with ferritin-like domain
MSSVTRITKSPRELYSIAKRLGSWDPESIPVAEDRPHWEALNPEKI